LFLLGVNINTYAGWYERMVPMNIEAFESYLKKDKRMTDHEAREVISRISWIETTFNISLEKKFNEGVDLNSIYATIMDVVVAEDKANLFYEAIYSYQTFLKIYCQ